MTLTVIPRFGAALGLVLGVAACSSQPMEMAGPGPYAGIWIVTDAFPAGPVTDMSGGPKGQMVGFGSGLAGDAAGRLCAAPSYMEGRNSVVAVLGGGEGDTATLRVNCAGEPFAHYAVSPDGTLMTRHGAWLLRLERGEVLAANPAPMAPSEPVMAAPMALAPPPPPPPPPAPVMAEAPPVLVYLASYKTEAWAKKGWGILAGHSPALKSLAPVTRAVDLKDKGKFIRLFAPAKDSGAAKAICKDLGKAISDCGAPGRDK